MQPANGSRDTGSGALFHHSGVLAGRRTKEFASMIHDEYVTIPLATIPTLYV